MAGKLFLHIGRNKAGSTTLQTAWLQHIDTLRAGGVDYVMFGQPSPPGYDLPSFPTHMALIDHVRDSPSSILVSHEGLCAFSTEFAAIMIRELATLDVELLFYVRPYREWAVSNYTFSVMIGHQTGDFDSYLDRLGQGVRFWPALKTWGDEIGWDRVRLRSLHPEDLVGGDLAVDGMAAIGLSQCPRTPSVRHNMSAAWIPTELVRFFLTGPSDDRAPIDRHGLATVLKLNELVNRETRIAAASSSTPVEQGRYLTQVQTDCLRDLYNADLELAAHHTGTRLSRDDGAREGTRIYMPSIDHVPPGLIAAMQSRIGSELASAGLTDIIGARRIEAFMTLGSRSEHRRRAGAEPACDDEDASA